MNTNVCSRPRPSGKEWSPKAGETERRHRLGGASYLKGVRSRLLDQQLKRNCSVLSQRGQTRKPNRLGRKTAFYGSLLHKKREGGKARVNRRAPSQICTATPSGVVTYGARAPSRFTNCVFCSCCQLNCKNFENYQRRTCNTFSYISPETR